MRDLRILVVDDERPIVELVSEYLRARGHHVVEANDGESAWKRLAQGGIDVVLSDVKMPRLSGPELLGRIRTTPDPVAVILMTGYATTESAVRAMQAGASGYLLKPFKLKTLWSTLERVALDIERRENTVAIVGLAELLEATRGATVASAGSLPTRLVETALLTEGVSGAALLLDEPACQRKVLHAQAGELAGQDLEHLVRTDSRSAPGLVLPLRIGDRTGGHLIALGSRQEPARRALQACCDIVGESLRRLRAEHPEAFSNTQGGHRAALGTDLPAPALDAWCGGRTGRELRRDPSLVGQNLSERDARDSARLVLEAIEGRGALWHAAWTDLSTRSGAWLPLVSSDVAPAPPA